MAFRINKALVDRVIRRCEASRGTISVHRSLVAEGVPGGQAGRWIGEGEALLRAGVHPDRVRCGTASCEEVLDLVAGKINRGIVSLGNGPPCPECGGRAWAVPSTEDMLRLRLAAADTRVGASLMEDAGRALGELVNDRDPEARSVRLQASKVVLAAMDPGRFGDKKTVRHEGTIGVRTEESWASGLTAEQVDSLPIDAVEALRGIAELQRMLDEQARLVVRAALAGEVHQVALPIAPLPLA